MSGVVKSWEKIVAFGEPFVPKISIASDKTSSMGIEVKASFKSIDAMKQFGVMSPTADQRVSILKWCFSMCLLSPF